MEIGFESTKSKYVVYIVVSPKPIIHWCTTVYHIPNGLVAMISACQLILTSRGRPGFDSLLRSNSESDSSSIVKVFRRWLTSVVYLFSLPSLPPRVSIEYPFCTLSGLVFISKAWCVSDCFLGWPELTIPTLLDTSRHDRKSFTG